MFILILNISQRNLNIQKKTFATIYIAALLLLYDILIIIVIMNDLPSYLGLVAIIIPISVDTFSVKEFGPLLYIAKLVIKVKI